MNTRTEHDSLGERKIPADALWGIHTLRAKENFAVSGRAVAPELVRAYALVKKACALANERTGHLSAEKASVIMRACDMIAAGEHTDAFTLDALQGGAGTSLNMNVNEVIANLALRQLSKPCGAYDVISPLDDVNKHQSTNDTFPTAVKVASLFLVNELEANVTRLLQVLQAKEKQWANAVKIGRTEMQPAVPITLGAEFGGYAELIAQDRWRISKTRERLRVINLGGTAVGTGLAAPRTYIFKATEALQQVSGLNVCRSENLIYATQNADAFVESSGILKTYAVSLSKISHDLRLMNLLGEIRLPAIQAGSSAMPGKVNPVICEAVIQAAMRVFADDRTVTDAAAKGSFEINEFMPLIADAFLSLCRSLVQASAMLAKHIEAIEADEAVCRGYLDCAPCIMTVFVPQLGYEAVQGLVKEFTASGRSDVRVFLTERFGVQVVDEALSPQRLLKTGF
jgi:aspartate ammonia-lyase